MYEHYTKKSMFLNENNTNKWNKKGINTCLYKKINTIYFLLTLFRLFMGNLLNN